MEVIKGKKGFSYRETVWLENGKRISRTFARKTDAKNWKAKTETEKRFNSTGFRSFKPKKLVEVAKEWIEYVGSLKKSRTIDIYHSAMKANINPHFADKYIGDIKAADLQGFVLFLKRKEAAPASINKMFSILRGIMEYAVVHEYIPESPIKKTFYQKVTQTKLDYYQEYEIRALLDQNKDEEIYPILFLAVHTGMRLSEILGLCWDCIDFQGSKITISRTLVKTRLQESTKNNKVRYFPMSPRLREMFLELRIKRTESNFVFLSNKGIPYNSDHFRERHFHKACEKAIIRKLRFHDLRHTFASHHMMKGGDLYELSKLLGHSDVTMTQRYAHLSEDHLVKASAIVDFGVGFTNGLSPNYPLKIVDADFPK